ncbi:hypothetical protein CDJ58_07060 [Campylobacter lari]|nr:hypothetical protein [Campylobacter lari]EAK5749148.1 hypothetical protein [Campylobacter lari]EAK9878343.1 hypothetical protein [Campylobacter lari]
MNKIKKYYIENKKMSIIILIGFLLFFLFVFLIVTNPSSKDEFNIESGFDSQNVKKEDDVKYNFNESNLSAKKDVVNPDSKNIFILEDKNDLNISKKNKNEDIDNNIPDISENSFNNLKQYEAIKEIEKTQKPKDMVLFLKNIKQQIFISKDLNSFKYDYKDFYIGDKFLNWYLVEDININFIRFKDQELNYSYNLRFYGE